MKFYFKSSKHYSRTDISWFFSRYASIRSRKHERYFNMCLDVCLAYFILIDKSEKFRTFFVFGMKLNVGSIIQVYCSVQVYVV